MHLSTTPLTQWLVVITGFFIKPAYMILAFVLILLLWKHKTRCMAKIRWAMITFFLGEAFCAANYLLTGGESELLDILHGMGMVGLGVFLPWGLFNLVDEWGLHFSENTATCSLLRLCGRCWKQHDVPCGLKRLFLFTAPTLAVIALMPLAAPLKSSHYILSVFNVETHFISSTSVLQWELRLYPILAAVLLLSSLVFLTGGRAAVKRAQVPFFIGLGFLLYSLFRFFLVSGYDGLPHWVNFWEELTELMTIIGVYVLLIVFRGRLGFSIKRKAAQT